MLDTSTKWYQITKSLEWEEFDTPKVDLASETKYWIKRIFKNRTHTTSSKNKFELYDFEVYDSYIEPTRIKEQNLSCYRIRDTHSNIYGATTDLSFQDFYKNSKTYSFTGSSNIENIIKAIVFMKEKGTFKTFEAIELSEELDSKLKYIEELEEKLEGKKD